MTDSLENEGVLADIEISPRSSKQAWRLIRFQSPEGVFYEYLTNDFTLEPGLIAFMYYRRWDEEKYFDAFKHDMAGNKAWGESARQHRAASHFGYSVLFADTPVFSGYSA